MSIFNPITHLNNWFQELAEEMGNLGFKWLTDFLVTPTDFSKIEKASAAVDWISIISITLASLFLVFNLLKHLIGTAGGFSRRSTSEITTKAIMGTALAILSPWIIPHLLLPINNYYVEFVRSKGIEMDTLTELIVFPTQAASFLVIEILVFAVLMLIVGIQTIIRYGELGMLTILAPFVFVTMQNEEMNLAPIWWREAVATVFQQSFQITILWLILNLLGSGKGAEDYIFAIGLMIVLIKTPKFLRSFLYSTGTGSAVVGAAGGAGKMAVYRYSMKKMTGK